MSDYNSFEVDCIQFALNQFIFYRLDFL